MAKPMTINLETKRDQDRMKNLLWKSMERTNSNSLYDFYEKLYDQIVNHQDNSN